MKNIPFFLWGCLYTSMWWLRFTVDTDSNTFIFVTIILIPTTLLNIAGFFQWLTEHWDNI